MTYGVQIDGVFDAGVGLEPEADLVLDITSSGIRGLFTAGLETGFVTLAEGRKVAAWLDRTIPASAYTLLPVSNQVPLVFDTALDNWCADFTFGAAPYVHNYSRDWRAAGFFLCSFKPAASAYDQYLFATDGFDARIPGGTSNLVIRYDGSTEMVIPIVHGSWSSLAVGKLDGKIRAWLDGVLQTDLTITDATGTASVMHVAGDTSAVNGWLGRIADVAIYGRYEPAFVADKSPIAWHDYVAMEYGIGA